MSKSYPIIIPLHPSGGALGNDAEARLAIRSLERHYKGDLKICVVAKNLPKWMKNVEFIHCGGGLKKAVQEAAKHYPDGFFWYYDDIILLDDFTQDELMVTAACRDWEGEGDTGWGAQLVEIRTRLLKEDYDPWDYSHPHGPYWFDKGMIDEAFNDWPDMKGKFPFESWILSKRNWPRRHGERFQIYGDFKEAPPPTARTLNFNNKGFSDLQLQNWLLDRFPSPSQFERTEKEAKGVTPLLFIHVPKNGGTSARAAINFNMRVRNTSHFPSRAEKVVRRRLEEPSTLMFGICRNPYDRAWSIFKFFNRRKVRPYAIDIMMEAFLSTMTVEEFWLRTNIPRLMDAVPHVKTQSYYLGPDVRVLRFENLEEEWNNLMAETGRSGILLPHLKASPGLPWQEALSDEVKAKIALYYAEDFERFGYEK